MFGIGFPELILILVVALVVFGPKQLPEVARAIGKGIREVKKATSEITDLTDLKLEEQSPKRAVIPANPANPQREMVPPVIKEENEQGEIIEKAPKEMVEESTVADAKALQVTAEEEKQKIPAEDKVNLNK